MYSLLAEGERLSDSISLQWVEVASAGILIIANVFVSWRLKLGLSRQIMISSLRMVIQLALLGIVLKQIFSLSSPFPVMGLAIAMTIIAGVSSVRRIEHRFDHIMPTAIFSVWASSWLVTTITVMVVVSPDPWYRPQVVIPLIGMVLGNSLTGISLAMDQFVKGLNQRRGEVEMKLCLGATRWEACRDVFSSASRTAMIPILNTMSVAGIVSLPGMMTGQLLAGANPIQAVQYQIVIMFVIAAAIAFGVMLALSGAYFKLTNSMHQIEWGRQFKIESK